MPDNDNDAHQTKLFEEYQRVLAFEPTSTPPEDLDPKYARIARMLAREFGGPEMDEEPAIDPEFVATLRRRLDARAAQMTAGRAVREHAPTHSNSRPLINRHAGSRMIGWAGLAALLLVALAAAAIVWTSAPDEVSAQEIVERASATLNSPDPADVSSFVMTEVSLTDTGNEQRRTETTYWYEAPDRWRIETEEEIMTGAGTSRSGAGLIGNGEEVWGWSGNEATPDKMSPTGQNLADLLRFGGGFGDLGAVLEAAGDCYSPERLEDDTVASRPAYVIDLGVTQCPSASMPETNARRVIWLDQETFFVLKTVQYDGRPDREGAVLTESKVTQIEYSVDVPDELFNLEMATDTANLPSEPTPTMPEPEPPPSLETFREMANYPIFVPTYLPDGLAAGPPSSIGGIDPGEPQVRIIYRTPDGAGELSVLNGPPGCCLSYKEGIEVTLPNGLPAHHITGEPGSGKGILWWVQDETYVSLTLTGLDLSQDELLKIAASMSSTAGLEPADTPADQSPTTGPTAMGDIGFTVLPPVWWPEKVVGWSQEERSDGRDGTMVVFAFDHRRNSEDHDMMTLVEQAVSNDEPGVNDPQASVEEIGGRQVTVVQRNGACTNMSWVQKGVLLSLTNAYDPPGELVYSCDEMRQVVAAIGNGSNP